MLNKGIHTKYLLDYKHGRIQQGLGIDCHLDKHIRFKPKQLNIILGHDNVWKILLRVLVLFNTCIKARFKVLFMGWRESIRTNNERYDTDVFWCTF